MDQRKILGIFAWERKDCISTSDPNFEEELKLGITPDESFGEINQPDKNGLKVKDFYQVKNLLNENTNKLEEHNRELWSLMATNMDADDPER